MSEETIVMINGPDLSWVKRVQTIEALDFAAVEAVDADPGWQLLTTGINHDGRTTLTYGWPYEGDE